MIKRSKKEKPTVFASNLYKTRLSMEWSQQKAADLLGIPRATYGSYEEGRAEPALELLKNIVSTFSITNLLAFLENAHFDHRQQDKDFTVKYESALDKCYRTADAKARRIVDVALGIGSEKVTC